MFYIKDQGRQIPIEDGEGGNVFTQCGDCGTEFEVDLVEAIRNGCDIYASSVYCPACSAKRLKAKKETDREIKPLAERYEDCGITEEIIRNLMEKKADLDDRAKLTGIRLGLGHEFHREELFSVDDLCHVTGETPEEALTRMREAGVSPITAVAEGRCVVSYYRVCRRCGANLDPGEKCDCGDAADAAPCHNRRSDSAYPLGSGSAGCHRKALCAYADQSTTQRSLTTNHHREAGTAIVPAFRR